MGYNTFRESDMKSERILSEYLNRNLYSNNIFTNVFRTDSLKDQLEGSDISLSIPSLNISNLIIDEKAQLYYLDGGLPTFAFELNFINKNGDRVEGWLTDSSKKTEYYQLLFLTAKKGFISISEIEKVEYIIVSRKKILDFINLDVEELRKKGTEIALSKEFHQQKGINKNYYFTHSTQLAESPVNIILRKNDLKSISLLSGFC